MRAHAYGLSLLVIAAVGYPAFLDPGDDDFPLSTYPMFARDRGRTAPVISALALGAQGQQPVPPVYIANSEAMQALQTLKKSVRAGPRSARALCQAIARRVAEEGAPAFAGATEIALVTRELDSIAYLAGDESEVARTVHARCELPMGEGHSP